MVDSVGAPDILLTTTAPNEAIKVAVDNRLNPPPVTTSSCKRYIEACARSNEKASRHDPLTTLIQAEKMPPFPGEPTYTCENGHSRPTPKALRDRLARISQDEIEQSIYDLAIKRIQSNVQMGAFIAEAGNFAATTCWEPMFAPQPPADFNPNLMDSDVAGTNDAENWPHVMSSLMWNGQTVSEIFTEQPVLAEFVTRIEMSRQKYLYPIIWRAAHLNTDFEILDEHTRKALSLVTEDRKHLLFWHLSLTSRNPAVQPPVPGAVRAIIEPFVKKWVDEAGMPVVWLEAGSPRARDVYSYLGFRVVDEIVVGKDEEGNGVKTWCMIYTKHR